MARRPGLNSCVLGREPMPDMPKIKIGFIAVMVLVCFFLGLAAQDLVRGRFSSEARAAIVTPQSGENVLPEPAREILGFIRERGLKTYRLSPVLRNNVYINQRVTESAWLVARPDPGSRYLFIDKSELSAYKSAGALLEKANVALVIVD